LPDQADKFNQILQLVETSDSSLGEDLWLIAERIMLYRLTRAGELKRVELAGMVHLLRRIVSETRGEQTVSSELLELDNSAADGFQGRAESNLSLVFTTIIDTAEGMNPDQLYRLISALRKMELPKQPVIDIEPLEKAEEYLSESFQHDNGEWGI
jgi:hypothetical protein